MKPVFLICESWSKFSIKLLNLFHMNMLNTNMSTISVERWNNPNLAIVKQCEKMNRPEDGKLLKEN